MEHTFHTPDAPAITVSNASGLVQLTCTDTDQTTVVIEPLRGREHTEVAEQTRVEQRNGILNVEVPQRRWGSAPRIAVRITAPVGTRLSARTASADVECTGTLAGLTVNGASSDVFAELVEGNCEVELASGDVRLGSVGRQLRVRTASGDVTVADAGSVEAMTASGDLTVGVVADGVHAKTASGDVHLADVSTGAVDVSTASGDVTVVVRRGTNVHLDLSTTSGDLRSDLTVDDTAPTADTAVLDLRVHTISGDVHVRRGVAA